MRDAYDLDVIEDNEYDDAEQTAREDGFTSVRCWSPQPQKDVTR